MHHRWLVVQSDPHGAADASMEKRRAPRRDAPSRHGRLLAARWRWCRFEREERWRLLLSQCSSLPARYSRISCRGRIRIRPVERRAMAPAHREFDERPASRRCAIEWPAERGAQRSAARV